MKNLLDLKSFKKLYEAYVIKDNYKNIENLLTYLLEHQGFQKTTKKPLRYSFFEGNIDNMPELSYKVLDEETRISTYTSDGLETKNTGIEGDIVISGPNKEKYVIKKSKFDKLYDGNIGGEIVPEQSARYVAHITKDLLNHFNNTDEVKFIAPWGQEMVLKSGDYLVKDGDSDFYRIAKDEYEKTYNIIKSTPPPSN